MPKAAQQMQSIFLLLVVCILGGQAENASPAKPALVTVAKDGIVEVQLDSNPTTGYTWTLASGSKGLEQMGSKYVAKSADGMVGGGGIQTYTFKATGDGENDLEFVYKVPNLTLLHGHSSSLSDPAHNSTGRLRTSTD